MTLRNSFWSGPTYGVIQAMKARGNQPGIIQQWMDLAYQWALDHKTPEAQAIRDWLPLYQPRPFYTAAELVPMFPALVVALGLMERPPRYSAVRLSHELDYGGLPVLKGTDDSPLFTNPATGYPSQYFIVERIHHWRKQRLTQEGFEDVYTGR